MPPKIRQLARQILHEPEEVSIAISKPNESIRQSAYICYEPQKMGIINAIFSQGVKGKTIIFSSSKLKVKQLTTALRRRNYNARAMHSDLDQPQREEVMLDYKNGKIDILVATDIVSRGIDITDIVLVINYDVPHDPEDYIHRIGRTARANAEGEAITFVSVDDQDRFYRIEKFLEREVPKMPLPEGLGEAPEYDIMSLDRRSSRKGGRGRSGKTVARRVMQVETVAKEISEDRNRQPLLQSTPKGHLPIRIGIPVKEKPPRRKEITITVTIIADVLPAITTGHRPILPQKRNKPDKFVLDISCRALQIVKPDCFCKILLSNKIEKQ